VGHRDRPGHPRPVRRTAGRSGLLVSGALLLGAGLPFDVEIHFELSAAALARSTPADAAWMLPAFTRYVDEVDPASFAHLVVRLNDPRHPALVER
jgi:hypothetical protein